MVTTGRVLAIVPARGGSKSVPRKNVRTLAGVPLLAYSIEAGLSARSVSRVIVSTDDPEIADVARRYGAEVPFLRPPELAGDTTPDLPVFQHALAWLAEHEEWMPDICVQLRPTSPLRPPDCVDRAIELLQADPATDSVRGVVVSGQNPYKMWRRGDDATLTPLLSTGDPEPFNMPRQLLPVTWWQTGHIDAIRSSVIRERHSMSGTRIKGLPIDAAYTCDIDSEADWQRTEWTLRHIQVPIVRPRARETRLPDPLHLVVFDFDGVMTDNRVWVTETGAESVACHRGDGLGLAHLGRLGVQTLVLSTESNPVVAARCRKLHLDFEQGIGDKASRLRAILDERGLAASQVLYVGNDVNDLGCMALVGCAVAVGDAHPDVIGAADLVLSAHGGFGAVRELCDRVARHLAPSGGITTR